MSSDSPVLIGWHLWFCRCRNKNAPRGHAIVGRGELGGQRTVGVLGIPGGNNYNELWRARGVYQ